MNGCFAFRFTEPDENKRTSLVIFCAGEFAINDLINTLKKDIEQKLIPHHVYLLTRKTYLHSLEILFSDPSFTQEFDALVGDVVRKATCAVVDTIGLFLYLNNKTPLPKSLQHAILESGMLEIFKRRRGLITSSGNYHFSKPSGDHCDSFIRASNLLVSSTEVSFLALSLLPYINKDIKRIYIDTSSIAYLVATALRISEKFNDIDVLIESFESYAIFDQPFDFVEDQYSFVIISASTSGSLARKLIKEFRFQSSQIVTLLRYNPKTKDSEQILFNITQAVPQGIVSTNSSICSYCKQGSRVIQISGDQFLPDTPKHELLVIRKPDFSPKRANFFKEFATTGVLGWNGSSSTSEDSKEHFYINVEQALNGNHRKFVRDFERALNRHLSRHTNAIIHLDDPGSLSLAKAISAYDSNIELISNSLLSNEKVNALQSVIVVAGAITSGRKLLSVARKLRGLNEQAVITYLVGFSKLPTTEAYEQLKKDLEQGGHYFYSLRNSPMPRIKEYTQAAWDVEQSMLERFSDDNPLTYSASSLPKLLSERLLALASYNANPNSLYLPTPHGNLLKLRKTFAFWSELNCDTEKSTQADVYWTIQSVLHDLRCQTKGTGLATVYHSTLISPVCFDRFNDGVIQSCLLRSAHPTELNYSLDDSFSRQITDIICSIINNWNDEQGEAALEFLVSLATNRLQVINNHYPEIMALKSPGMPDDMLFLFDRISEIHKV